MAVRISRLIRSTSIDHDSALVDRLFKPAPIHVENVRSNLICAIRIDLNLSSSAYALPQRLLVRRLEIYEHPSSAETLDKTLGLVAIFSVPERPVEDDVSSLLGQ